MPLKLSIDIFNPGRFQGFYLLSIGSFYLLLRKDVTDLCIGIVFEIVEFFAKIRQLTCHVFHRNKGVRLALHIMKHQRVDASVLVKVG